MKMPLLKINFLIFFFAAIFYVDTAFSQAKRPKVFVFTDIKINAGDPDDRQSLVHLLWYANELDILGIVPDRWQKGGREACQSAIDAYRVDYRKYDFSRKGYPKPNDIIDLVPLNEKDALKKFIHAVNGSKEIVNVLIWGNMKSFKNALFAYPELADQIRVITIGTGLKYGPKDEVPGEDCDVPNWNGKGRNEVYKDKRFRNLWWLEINWTYNGMFSGDEPKQMFEKLSRFGDLGQHIDDVTKKHPWARYFRVGDTPSVLYIIDKNHEINNPEISSWAGKFKRPFPQKRPNYFTDDNDNIDWDYENPCNTWSNLQAMYAYNKSTLEKERPEMYSALLDKLKTLYRSENDD